MRLGKLALVTVLGFCTVANAQDEVVVDLSVLDSLDSSYVAPSEPLFPVLPKKSKPLVKKVKKASKTRTKSAIKAKVSEPTVKSKPNEDIKVVDVEPIIVVDVEPKPVNFDVLSTPKIIESEQGTSNHKAVYGDIKAELKATATEDSSLPAVVVPATNEPTNTIPSKVSGADNTITDDTTSSSDLLIPTTPNYKPVVNSISFAEGVDELSAEQMVKIDSIVNSFEDINTNKIAIYSYNLDDGVDSFKKKRISLNRAVEVRGYLIKQGYKNFSIKVININSNSNKVNTVELEEIKKN